MNKTWISRLKPRLIGSHRSSAARRRASQGFVERLEPRCVLSATAGLDDDHGLEEVGGVDEFGNEWHALPVAAQNVATSEEAQTVTGGAPFPLAQTFFLNSNPTANHTIYLDFNGHVTSGTSWKGGATFTTPEFNIDNTAGFSNTELYRIQYIWQRVAEDFIPFNVNVTTQEPASLEDLKKSGSGDTRWGVRVCIGGSSSDWYGSSAGGVAYVGSFNWNSDTPTYVFTAQLGNGNEKYTAEAISHEAGHTVGLSHDGRTSPSEGYYQGHGSGETGWAPIMGVGYYRNLTQWSKGEYLNANQTQDDLAIITTQNGFGYRVDDYGNTNETAGAANLVNATTIDGAGIIERTSDVDVFRFTTGAGTISIDVLEFERGANLDILAELYDGNSTLVTSANPADFLEASLSATVGAGTYYLHISGTGKGDPLGTGYSDYGSLGQYSFTGTIVDAGSLPTISISNATANEDADTMTFLVTLSAPLGSDTTVNFTTANGSANAGEDFQAASGTVTFAAGETLKEITINLLDDPNYEGNESFNVNLSGAVGAVLLDSQGVGTIVDNDPLPPPSISINDVSVNEGNTTKKTGAKLTNLNFTVSLSAASTLPITVDYSTADGTATTVNNDYQAKSGTLTFAPGVTTQTVTVVIVGDTTVEPTETFTVNLSGATNAIISDDSGTGTILNDDSGGGGRPKGRSAGAVVVESALPRTTTSTTSFVANTRRAAARDNAREVLGTSSASPAASVVQSIAEGRRDVRDSVSSRSESQQVSASAVSKPTTTDAVFESLQQLFDVIG